MAVKGVFASDLGIQGARKGDFASALLQTQPTGTAPMFALTSGMESQDASDTVVTWFEENHLSGRVQATAVSASISLTALTLADASFIVAGTILLAEASGEYMYVTAVTGNVCTVTRGFAGSTPAGYAASAYFQRIGTGYEEGSSKPTATQNLGFPRFNFTQIFRNTWDVTGTARYVQYYTGNLVAKSKADCGLFHAEDIERSLLWGKRSIGVQNSKPFRTMDGILNQIVTNVTVEGGTTTWDEIDAFLRGIFERNIKGKPNERIAFAGNTVIAVLNKIVRLVGAGAPMELSVGQTEFGLKVNKWLTPYGDVSLMTHPLMNESPLWTKDLYILHPGAIRTRYLRRTMEDNYESGGQRAGADEDFGVITTEMTVQYMAELTGGKFTGINTAA